MVTFPVASVYRRILVCGDRNWSDLAFFERAMQTWIDKHGLPALLIEGCARGADSMAGHLWAVAHGVKVAHFPAQWDTYGKSAGPRRNEDMLKRGAPQAVIAFHTDLASSKGTAHMVRIARAASVPVWVPFPQQP